MVDDQQWVWVDGVHRTHKGDGLFKKTKFEKSSGQAGGRNTGNH